MSAGSAPGPYMSHSSRAVDETTQRTSGRACSGDTQRRRPDWHPAPFWMRFLHHRSSSALLLVRVGRFFYESVYHACRMDFRRKHGDAEACFTVCGLALATVLHWMVRRRTSLGVLANTRLLEVFPNTYHQRFHTNVMYFFTCSSFPGWVNRRTLETGGSF